MRLTALSTLLAVALVAHSAQVEGGDGRASTHPRVASPAPAPPFFRITGASPVAAFGNAFREGAGVKVSSPVPGQIVRQAAALKLSASAIGTDTSKLIRVEYWLTLAGDTAAHTLGRSTALPDFPRVWAPVYLGPGVVYAEATNSLGQVFRSEGVAIVLTLPNRPPVVAITSLLNNASLSASEPVTVAASAQDGDEIGGDITKVDFYRDSMLFASDSSAPYSVEWIPAPGRHVLQARAYDNHVPPVMAVSDTVAVNVAEINLPPVVSAGRDTVLDLPNKTLVLSGAASDPEGKPLTLRWTAGAGVNLARPNTLSATAQFTGVGIHFLTLRAVDAGGLSSQDQVAVTVRKPPEITQDLPDSQVVAEKSKAFFAVTAVGYPAVAYQWQFAGASGNFQNVGTNSANHTVESASAGSAGRYRVVVRNGAGADAVSRPCRLLVVAAPFTWVRDTVLMPGETLPMEAGFSLRHAGAAGTGAVRVKLKTPEDLDLKGFEGVSVAMQVVLEPPAQALAFPKLVFSGPAGELRSMYRAESPGKVRYVSGVAGAVVSQAGTYFPGLDISPPRVTYEGERFVEGDSTEVRFRIEDNVVDLTYDVLRGDVAVQAVGKPVAAPVTVAIRLKHAAGILKPLYLRVAARDARSATFLPGENDNLSLSQRLSPLKGPSAWRIGGKTGWPWDLISIPLDMDPPLPFAALIKANPGLPIQGAMWNDSLGEYESLSAETALLPGHAYWVGSHSRVVGLVLDSGITKPQGPGDAVVRLKHGWNQVGAPNLEKLYWPSARGSTSYPGSKVKGLWGYDAGTGEYQESDSLQPWRGYFVYNHGSDTAVKMLDRPAAPMALAKEGAGKDSRLSIGLAWGTSQVQIGADVRARDGLGLEDEMTLPTMLPRNSVRAVRSGHSLATDWVRWDSSGVLQWKVVMNVAEKGDSLHPLKVTRWEIPPGYETWALSRARGMKFKVGPEAEIPASGLAGDTLLFISSREGDADALGLLQGLALEAPGLDLQVSSRVGGFLMALALPVQASFQAAVWGVDGSLHGKLDAHGLPGGLYHFTYAMDFRSGSSVLPPGVYALSLDLKTARTQRQLTKKIVISH